MLQFQLMHGYFEVPTSRPDRLAVIPENFQDWIGPMTVLQPLTSSALSPSSISRLLKKSFCEAIGV